MDEEWDGGRTEQRGQERGPVEGRRGDGDAVGEKGARSKDRGTFLIYLDFSKLQGYGARSYGSYQTPSYGGYDSYNSYDSYKPSYGGFDSHYGHDSYEKPSYGGYESDYGYDSYKEPSYGYDSHYGYDSYKPPSYGYDSYKPPYNKYEKPYEYVVFIDFFIKLHMNCF